MLFCTIQADCMSLNYVASESGMVLLSVTVSVAAEFVIIIIMFKVSWVGTLVGVDGIVKNLTLNPHKL